MDRRELEILVKQGEGSRLEFKRKVKHPDKIAREFVAFANTRGGTILIGVGDDGTVYGSKDAKGEAYILEQWLAHHVSPPLPFIRSEIQVTSRSTVVMYEVGEGQDKPYRVHLVDEEGEIRKLAFVRRADMSIRASREVTQVLRMRKHEKGVNIRFGENERQLLSHLETNKDITLDSAQELLRLNKRKTSGLLVLLTLAGLIRIHPNEKGDRYSLSKTAFS